MHAEHATHEAGKPYYRFTAIASNAASRRRLLWWRQ